MFSCPSVSVPCSAACPAVARDPSPRVGLIRAFFFFFLISLPRDEEAGKQEAIESHAHVARPAVKYSHLACYVSACR